MPNLSSYAILPPSDDALPASVGAVGAATFGAEDDLGQSNRLLGDFMLGLAAPSDAAVSSCGDWNNLTSDAVICVAIMWDRAEGKARVNTHFRTMALLRARIRDAAVPHATPRSIV